MLKNNLHNCILLAITTFAFLNLIYSLKDYRNIKDKITYEKQNCLTYYVVIYCYINSNQYYDYFEKSIITLLNKYNL